MQNSIYSWTSGCHDIIITQVCVVVGGRYLMEVRVNGYSNPTGKYGHVRDHCQTDTPGEFYCCDSFRTTCSGEDWCNSYFVYCLRPLGEVMGLGCLARASTVSSINRNDNESIDISHSSTVSSINRNDNEPIDFSHSSCYERCQWIHCHFC